MKEGSGPPGDIKPYVLLVVDELGYLVCLGSVCPSDPRVAHTFIGVVLCEDIAAHIGPLPDPTDLLRRVGH